MPTSDPPPILPPALCHLTQHHCFIYRSVESDILVEPEGDSDVVDDFVVPESEILRIRDRPENQHKLARRAAAYKVPFYCLQGAIGRDRRLSIHAMNEL